MISWFVVLNRYSFDPSDRFRLVRVGLDPVGVERKGQGVLPVILYSGHVPKLTECDRRNGVR